MGFSDLLLEEFKDHPSVEDIQEIKKAGQRGAALTANILSFSRHERPTPDALSANEVVMGISGMLKQLLPGNVTLEFAPHPELPKVMAELGQVEQALVNLVVNARDAMPDGGRITVNTAHRTVAIGNPMTGFPPRPGRYVTISVADTGTGMDGPTLDRIFEPFFTTKPKGAGTGLGLSTVLSIVQSYEGGLEVRSEPAQGTVFVLYFPEIGTEETAKPRAALPEPLAASRSDIEEPNGSAPTQGPPLEVDTPDEQISSLSNSQTEQLRHLSYVVSHDLREPLRMVSSYLGLVKRRAQGQLSGELLEFMDYAVDGAQRMQRMLDGVLRYSRSLRAIPTAEPISVKAVYERIRVGLPEADAALILWEGESTTLLGSAEHLGAILRELISNALKFANPLAPKVVVRCRDHEDCRWIEVLDNGPGIPQEDVEKCFRLFGRLHGREDSLGLGVGLTVARCLAEKYEAEVTVAAGPSGGTLALLRWPAHLVAERMARP